MKQITTVLIDDEQLSREKLRFLLQRDPMFNIVDECSNGRDAIQAIYTHRPALVFIDIQMPDVDGISVVRSIDPHTRPLIVLTTAYSDYAVQAFEAGALDYLLKPFDEQRLAECLRRVKAHLVQRHPTDAVPGLFALNRFLVRADGRVLFFEAEEIDWIEAASNYVEIHTGSQSYLVRYTMNELEKRLRPTQFLRIHRSYIVNVGKIRGVQPCKTGEYVVRLQNGKELPSSRGYREHLDSIIENAI